MNNTPEIIKKAKQTLGWFAVFAVLICIILLLKLFFFGNSRLIERHGDYKAENSNTEVDAIDKLDYRIMELIVLMVKEERTEPYTTLELFSDVKLRYGYDNRIDNRTSYYQEDERERTTLYNLAVKNEMPEMLIAFNECKKTNDIELCYSALNQYDKLYADGVVEPTSYKMFVENAAYTREQQRENELRIELNREIEAARILDEKRRTKLYSCVETGDNLTCTKVKD